MAALQRGLNEVDVMKKVFIGSCAALLGAISAAAVAAPSVSALSAAGGAFEDGVEVTASGSGFGTHSLSVSWLGGSDGAIETGAIGKSPANVNGWVFNQGAGCNMTVASTQVRSGSKALFCALNGNDKFNGAIRYGYPQDIKANQDIFVSWWVRRVHSGGGQWKMFRINYQNDIQDDAPQTVMFNWDGSPQFFVRSPDAFTSAQSWNPPYPTQDARWYRMDFHVRTSSLGQADGKYVITRFDPAAGVPVSQTITGKTYPANASTFYRWFIWQNYIGNGVNTQDTWMDDLYVQVGTQARVELCDKPTWETCTFREIQQPVRWSDGSVTLKFNRGGFKAGDTAYLYVVDGSGVASRGVQLTVGGNAAPPPPAPRPPGNFQVQ